MKFLVATFDHAHPGSHGNYWAYAHPDLATAVLDQFYFDVVAPALRSHPEWAGLPELSGFATLGAHWACWFKRFGVGNDLKERPGRFVIACAFIERSELAGRDSGVVLTSSHFSEIERIARKQCPLPSPSLLSVTVECNPAWSANQLLTQLSERGSFQWRGPEALTQLGGVAAIVSRSQELRAFVVEISGLTTVYSDLLTGSSPKPIAIPAQNQSPVKTDARLLQAVPADLPKFQDRSPSQRREFVLFVMGLVVGLGFGFWFGRKYAPESLPHQPTTESPMYPPASGALPKTTQIPSSQKTPAKKPAKSGD